MANGLNDRDYRNYCFLFASHLIATGDDLDAGERTHTVVYTNDTLGIVRYQCQSVLYAVEACLATVSQQVLHLEIIFLAEFLPIRLLCLWQHQDNLQVGSVLTEPLQRPHQYRLSAYRQKLLRNVTSHPQPLASGDDDDVVHQAIRCL